MRQLACMAVKKSLSCMMSPPSHIQAGNWVEGLVHTQAYMWVRTTAETQVAVLGRMCTKPGQLLSKGQLSLSRGHPHLGKGQLSLGNGQLLQTDPTQAIDTQQLLRNKQMRLGSTKLHHR